MLRTSNAPKPDQFPHIVCPATKTYCRAPHHRYSVRTQSYVAVASTSYMYTFESCDVTAVCTSCKKSLTGYTPQNTLSVADTSKNCRQFNNKAACKAVHQHKSHTSHEHTIRTCIRTSKQYKCLHHDLCYSSDRRLRLLVAEQ